ncbi:MAG TPA: histone deacetylase [Chthoniobacterales bacterium]
MRLYYHPRYVHLVPPDHPFPMEKFPQAYALLKTEWSQLQVCEAPLASLADLGWVHSEVYLRKLAGSGLSDAESFRLGFKWSTELFTRCRYETGGTVAALSAALADGVSANLAGGTHHAFSDRGLGFCVLNDVAVGIRGLQRMAPAVKVLVIDTDAHQGNGTHAIFRQDPRVFTYSIHVEKNYPTVKEPGDLDVGLPRWVDGETYLRDIDQTLPAVLERFEPDLAVWISGADPHENDRFGQMRLTTHDLSKRDRFVAELCRSYEVPLAALYGGGYNRAPGMTARLHANTVSTVAKVFGLG